MAKEKSNVKALIEFKLSGRTVQAGEVVAKSDFASKGEWQNLAHMRPARVEETDDAVGKVDTSAPKKATRDGLPGAK